MLDAGGAPELVSGLTLFRDHEDPSRFYAMPEPPRIAVDDAGAPRASLVMYRGPIGTPGGAFFQMEVEVGLSADQRRAAESELSARGVASPAVVEAPWIEGHAELLGWMSETGGGGPEDRWIVRRLASVTPSLLPGARAVFALRLNEEGAVLLERALSNDGLPAGVAYELSTLGLMGPLGIDVDADLRAIHERLSLEARAENQWVKARIQRVLEQLTQENLIVTRVVDASGDSDSSRAEALRRAYEEIALRLFEPSITPAAEQTPTGGTAQYLQIGLSLRLDRDSIEEKTTFHYRERRTRRVVHRPQATLARLTGGNGASLVRRITLGDDFFASTDVHVRLIGDLAGEGLDSLVVHMEWPSAEPGGKATFVRELVLTDSSPEATFKVPVAAGTPYVYRVQARALAGSGIEPVRESETRTGNMANLVVLPGDLFPSKRLTVVAFDLDDAIDRVEAEIVVDPPAFARPRTIELRRTGDSAVVQIGGLPVRSAAAATEPPAPLAQARLTYRCRDGVPAPPPALVPIDSELLIVRSPFAPPIRVRAIPRAPEGVSVTLELIRQEPSGFSHAVTLQWPADDRDVRTAVLRRLSPESASYRYRVTQLFEDGRLSQSEWIDSTSAVLVVGPTDTNLHLVRAVLVRGGPKATGDLAVEVTMEPVVPAGEKAGEPVRRLLEGDASEAEMALFFPKGAPLRWTAVVRRFGPTGAITESRLTGDTEVAVLDAGS